MMWQNSSQNSKSGDLVAFIKQKQKKVGRGVRPPTPTADMRLDKGPIDSESCESDHVH